MIRVRPVRHTEKIGQEFALSCCYGKEAFKGHGSASKVLRRQRKSKTHKERLQAYRCPKCHDWHIGRMDS
jgi:hypothetical protein